MLKYYESWEFNILGIYNYKKAGPFDALYNFIKDNHSKFKGDILEAGVYKGSSTIGLALLLKELNSNKKVFGFDNFSGFPAALKPEDDFSQFKKLYDENKITKEHYEKSLHNITIKESLADKKLNPLNISTSTNFSDTSIEHVQKKINMFKLDNIELVKGDFENTMTQSQPYPNKIFACLIDCNLYDSYIDTLNFVWPRLEVGGMIYVDEYYSLKFPGARIATDKFLADKNADLICYPKIEGEFERWYIIKK
tara:strand:- start:14 stop:769 length:756 start_codon:yes stop_codon:yes gene_type:complete